jgi:hypothetical protein
MAFRAGEHSYRRHALRQMSTRGPTIADYERAIAYGDIEVVGDYPEYDPGDPEYRPCMLIIGWVGDVAFHIVVTYPPYPLVITVYPPQLEPDEWTPDFRRRRRA